jgi:hypothetical protein
MLLFCLGSGTDWKQAGITLKAVAGMVGKPLLGEKVIVTPTRGGLALTHAGRAALRELLRDL